MAGAGYKLFNTGDVLTAAQVNTYLMEQTVMVFADAAARTTALTGVVSEGMISYLKDTNAVEVYNGSAWVASDDPNAIQNTIVDAKGDLITATAADTPARLAVGNNGETLVADSSASTGLRWQGSTIAGRNFLINGGMDIWQRSTSAAATGGSYASADRWWNYTNSGAATVSRESTIVPAGSQYAMKIASTSAGTSIFHGQVIETANAVRLAGETITVSAKVAASTSVGVSLIVQYNTSVDSIASWTTVTATSGGSATPTSTTYVNLTGVYAMPSTAKTIRIGFQHTSTVASGVDLYIGNIQTEIGSVATPFTRAAGTLAGELQAAQRYYFRFTGPAVYSTYGQGGYGSAVGGYISMDYPVTLRTTPSSIDFGNLAVQDLSGGAITAVTTLTIDQSSLKNASLAFAVASGGTAHRPVRLLNNNNAAGHIGLSAEL